jgi:hypothetical protein
MMFFIKLFGDDAKIYMLVDNICDRDTLQNGLDLLLVWAAKWQLSIAVPKCSVFHIGSRNMGYSYS